MSYADYEWFLDVDKSKYAGKWVAIIDKAVVAAGYDLNKVVEEARQSHPMKKPILTRIKDRLSVL